MIMIMIMIIIIIITMIIIILSFVSRCNGTSTVVLYEPVRPENWQNTAGKVKESRLGYSIQPYFVVRGTIPMERGEVY